MTSPIQLPTATTETSGAAHVPDDGDGTVFFVGNATVLIRYAGTPTLTSAVSPWWDEGDRDV